jgi:glutaredoxin
MTDVQILSTPGCVGCEQLKRLVADLIGEFPGMTWEEIDLVEHPEVAAE